jgi:hypothetical protein
MPSLNYRHLRLNLELRLQNACVCRPHLFDLLELLRFIFSLCPLLLATMAALEHFLQGNSSKSTRGLLRIIILLTIAAAAISARLFSVIREHASPFESAQFGMLMLHDRLREHHT